MFWAFSCVPGGARTHDPLIKSQLLYQLSYRNVTHSSFNPCLRAQKYH